MNCHRKPANPAGNPVRGVILARSACGTCLRVTDLLTGTGRRPGGLPVVTLSRPGRADVNVARVIGGAMVLSPRLPAAWWRGLAPAGRPPVAWLGDLLRRAGWAVARC